MDDAARFVCHLHDKLTELDGKVAAYQRTMLAEFHKYMDDCLKDSPDHVSQQVSQAIAESMSMGRYPALSPPVRSAPDSPAIDGTAWDGRKSPPPILPHTSGTPKESPRDPHAREKEFHGLFTPGYLPLLEGEDCACYSPPMSPSALPEGPSLPLSTANVKQAEQLARPRSEGGDSGADMDRSSSSSSSSSSSGSESKVRRSALRRTSGSTKGSPRRVRFEVAGQEVFPASPAFETTVTPVAESGAGHPPEADEPPAPATADESTAYSGISLLDVPGEEDFLPKPRKVSSTQKLQALTRCPPEDAGTWREVNAITDSTATMNGAKPERAQDARAKVDSQAASLADTGDDEEPEGVQLGAPIEERAVYDHDDEDTSASEDDFLSIRPRGKSLSSSESATPVPRPSEKTTAAPQPNGNADLDDDHEPLFDLDEEAGQLGSQSSKHAKKYLPDADSDDEDEIPGRLRKAAREEGGDSVPPVSPSSALMGRSIGSYMGRPVTSNPIKDPKLYDEIAGMKDVHFFVGSIDGRTGVEPADLGSYRAASLGRAAPVAPRSFTERLALEEEMERRKVAGSDDEL